MQGNGEIAESTTSTGVVVFIAFVVAFIGFAGVLNLGFALREIQHWSIQQDWSIHGSLKFRDLKWAAVFGGFGGGVLCLGVVYFAAASAYRNRTERRFKEHRRVEFPDQPWRWRLEWNNGRIASSAKSRAVLFLFGAVVYNCMFSVPLIAKILEDHGKGRIDEMHILMFISIAFVGFGLVALVYAVIATAQWLRYRHVIFVMDPMPGAIGGNLRGYVETSVPLNLEGSIVATLASINLIRTTYQDGTSARTKTSTVERTLFETSIGINSSAVMPGPNGSKILIVIPIPEGQRASDDRDRESEIVWRLTVKAFMYGADFNNEFEVPVFQKKE